MYTAGIDAKDKAPSPAGALFASVLMNVGFVGIFRFYVIISPYVYSFLGQSYNAYRRLPSIFVATVYMTKVKNIKRMFAYSSIEHMGIDMLGLVAGGSGIMLPFFILFCMHLLNQSMFFQMGQIYRIYKSKSIYDVGNYFKYNLTDAMVLLFGFFIATAMPPSGMFVSEFLIFRPCLKVIIYGCLLSLYCY